MEHPDFAVLLPDETVRWAYRRPEEPMHKAIGRYVPNLARQAGVRVQFWYPHAATRDMPDNRVAGLVLGRLGYYLPRGWAGVLAISMEEDDSGYPSLDPDIEELIDEAAHAPDWCLPW